jgi:hypothetical protein
MTFWSAGRPRPTGWLRALPLPPVIEGDGGLPVRGGEDGAEAAVSDYQKQIQERPGNHIPILICRAEGAGACVGDAGSWVMSAFAASDQAVPTSDERVHGRLPLTWAATGVSPGCTPAPT